MAFISPLNLTNYNLCFKDPNSSFYPRLNCNHIYRYQDPLYQLSCPIRARISGPNVIQPKQALITIDVGSSSVKSALYYIHDENSNLDGHGMLGTVFRKEHTTRSETSGIVTQKPNDWYKNVIQVIRDVLEVASDTRIVAVSVTGQMQDLIAVGTDPPHLLKSDALLYSDTRAVSQAEYLTDVVGAPVLATSLLAKLKLLSTPPSSGVQLDYRLLFGAADYIVYRLCEDPGNGFTDATTVSTTGLSIGPTHREYDVNLLQRAGLGNFVDYFPDILQRPKPVGRLCASVANEIGAPHLTGIDVIHGGGDAYAATVGVGCGSDGSGAYLYAGTTGWIATTVDISRKENRDVLHSKSLFCLGHASSCQHVIVAASVVSVGSAIRHACEKILLCDVSKLDEMAEESCIGSNGVVYIPYLNGRRCPRPVDVTRGGFYGMSLSTERCDMARAVVEGVVFSFVEASRELPKSVESSILRVSGGVSGCKLFLKGISALIGDVEVFEEECGLVGAASVISISPLDAPVSKGSSSSNVARVHIFQDKEENVKQWQKSYNEWGSVVESVERLWGEGFKISKNV